MESSNAGRIMKDYPAKVWAAFLHLHFNFFFHLKAKSSVDSECSTRGSCLLPAPSVSSHHLFFASAELPSICNHRHTF